MPQISIVTPTYHRPELLRRAIESVRQQTDSDFEQFIVRDGCTQATPCALCRETDALGAEIAAMDSRIHYEALPEHKGWYGYFSRNRALEQSTAPLIAYLDDDNWWQPNHLETLRSTLTGGNFGFVYSGTIIRNHSGHPIFRRFTKVPYHTGIDTNEIMHTRKLIADFGPWKSSEEFFDHDWELVCRWMRNRVPYVCTGIASSNYQLRPDYPVWRFWYSYWKHRVMNAYAKMFIPEARRYVARKRPPVWLKPDV
jgi:glycosyltransferase involved in cell wall biosynthesis